MPVIIRDVTQGTDEWKMLRTGIPTSSNFNKIITSTGKPSAQSKAYMNQLLADWQAGEPTDEFEPTAAMKAGTAREAQARELYEFINDEEIEQITLCYKDDRRLVAASPDGLIGDNGVWEAKCPKAGTLTGYRLDNKLPMDYVPQVQGQLWVMDREYCQFFGYHPKIPPFLIRVERDEKFIESLDKLMVQFINEMLEKREKLNRIREAA